MKRILVTGAGGFIGHHMVRYLKDRGFWVRGVDIKYPEFSRPSADEFLIADLRDRGNTVRVAKNIDQIYAYACNMGGIGYITRAKAEVLRDNILINTHTAEAARVNGVKKIFFASSACVYPEEKQLETTSAALRESDAYPANPDTEYGWEKLLAERIYQSFQSDFGLDVKIARYHNIYGVEGEYDGGREKAPAAICRKVAMAKENSSIEIWGDGTQTRSFCFIDDCLDGTYRLMNSECGIPLNIGSDRFISINDLVDLVCKLAGKNLKKEHNLEKPQGVRGRNSDNTLLRQELNWEPITTLEDGFAKTYQWILSNMAKQTVNEALRANQHTFNYG